MATVGGRSTAVQMSKSQFEKLIKTIKSLAPEPLTQKEKSKGSFANCKIRYGGQGDPDAVNEFITAIEAYKEVEQINDENALKGISLLFARDAIIWWKGVRREAKTWQDALNMLREHFSPAKAPYEIYLEIFETKQKEFEKIDTYILKQRALLARLPENLHDEETELNFIYGLILPKFRQHIPRHHVKTFREFLEKARTVEKY